MHSRLVLFDIDGTLLDVRGVGLRALQRAATDLYGEGCPELELRGATDSGLAREILAAYGVAVSDESVARFFEAYLLRLKASLAGEDFDGVLLPGVRELLEALRTAGIVLGLLTGNIAAGAAAKVGHFGLSEYFAFGAFGDDHHDRDQLGPVALARAAAMHGRSFVAENVVVVGDTPKDVSCGKALGAMTLCVATGSFAAEDLRRCGADLVVDSFSRTADILAALQRPRHNGD